MPAGPGKSWVSGSRTETHPGSRGALCRTGPSRCAAGEKGETGPETPRYRFGTTRGQRARSSHRLMPRRRTLGAVGGAHQHTPVRARGERGPSTTVPITLGRKNSNSSMAAPMAMTTTAIASVTGTGRLPSSRSDRRLWLSSTSWRVYFFEATPPHTHTHGSMHENLQIQSIRADAWEGGGGRRQGLRHAQRRAPPTASSSTRIAADRHHALSASVSMARSISMNDAGSRSATNGR